jgi:hypothetical protein
VGKPEGNRPLGRPRRKWVDNIKIDLRDIGWESIEWIDLAQNKDQWKGSCEHGDEPSVSLKCCEIFSSFKNVGFSRRAQFYDVVYLVN